MDRMFTPEGELPAGVGFARFGPAHLAALGIVAAVSAAVVAAGCRMAPRRRQTLLKGMALGMIGMEMLKDAFLAAEGAFSVGYLPLHLCSLCMFLCAWFAWRPGSDAAGQMVYSLCFSGGLAALLFPDWTDMPVYHILSIHSFLYHGMLVQFGLIAVISGMARPRLGRLWKVGAFLVGAAIPIYGLNRALGTNYMFLNRPVPGTPLALAAKLPGRWGYLLGCAGMAAGILTLLDLPFTLAARRRKV